MAKRKRDPAPEHESEAVERRVDDLYRRPPQEFVAARNALAKDLRGGGDGEAAKRVRPLRRPSAAAWLINRISLEEPRRIERLAAAGDDLREAQRRAIESGGGGAELRGAASRERDEIAGLIEAAREIVRESGVRVNERVFEQVGETLQASGTDEALRGEIATARVQKERSAATLGTFADAVPPRGKRGARRGKGAAPRAKGGAPRGESAAERPKARTADRELERARRELRRLRKELATSESRMGRAQERVERADTDLKSAKQGLTDRRRETKRLRREVEAAAKRAGGR